MFRRLAWIWLAVFCLGCGNWDWYVPIDGPIPDTPIVAPVGPHEFRCLILTETGDLLAMPAQQRMILTSGFVRDYLKSHCVKAEDGTPEFRILDKDQQLTGIWKEIVTKWPMTGPPPWMWASDGSTGYSGPLVEDPDRFLATIKPYAEKK